MIRCNPAPEVGPQKISWILGLIVNIFWMVLVYTLKKIWREPMVWESQWHWNWLNLTKTRAVVSQFRTSWLLAKKLAERKTSFFGSIRSDRRKVPKMPKLLLLSNSFFIISDDGTLLTCYQAKKSTKCLSRQLDMNLEWWNLKSKNRNHAQFCITN